MHIVRPRGLIRKNAVQFRKRIKSIKEAQPEKHSITEVVDNDLAPATSGSGIKKLAKKMEQVKIQNTDDKLKKFISFRF